MVLSTIVQQILESLNDFNLYLLYFPKQYPKQVGQGKIANLLYQANAPE
jgi:hypothetical protein